MMHGMRCITVLAMHAVAAQLASQSPIAELDAMLLPEVEKRLASTDPAEAAWGGYLAHRYRLRGAVRALAEAMQRWREAASEEARWARLHLLDGMLASGAPIAAEQVEFLLVDKLTRDAAFLAIAAEPKLNLHVLAQVAMAPAEEHDLVRASAGRLLAQHELRVDGLAAFMLQSAKCSLRVRVEAPNTTWNSAGRLGGRARVLEKLKQMPGFPPLVRIELSQTNTKDVMRTMVGGRTGATAIVARREEQATYVPWDLRRSALTDVPSQNILFDVLTEMLHTAEPIEPVVDHTVLWQSPQAFLAECTQKRDALRLSLDSLVAGLRTGRWLDEDELVGFRIPIDVMVADEREDKSVALPELPAETEPQKKQ
jgi:hypothetical protein